MDRKKFLELSTAGVGLFALMPLSCISKLKPSPTDKDIWPLIPPLRRGDKVAIVAPAYGMDKSLQPAIDWLTTQGLVTVTDYCTTTAHHRFSGTDTQRTADFQKALDDDTVQALWCVRGGYGSIRIIDRIDFSKFRKNPKWIIGYSDITVFHSHIQSQYGIPTLHATMPKSLPTNTPESLESLKKAIFGEVISYKIPGSNSNKLGMAQGMLIGGNLTILHSLCGSSSSIKTEDKILFIEDIGEYLYSIDRMMMNLKRNGYFNKLKGLIIGEMTALKDTTPSFGETVQEIVLNTVAEYNFPVVFDFPSGHGGNNRALILGQQIHLVVEQDQIKLNYIARPLR